MTFLPVFIIWVLVPVSFLRPVGHGSERAAVPPSMSTSASSAKCYFAELRKTPDETKDRPEKSKVTTSCSTDLKPLSAFKNEHPGSTTKHENPLALLLCRGTGECDLNFEEPSTLQKWGNTQICSNHADELLKHWSDSHTVYRDMHIYREKRHNLGQVDVCSIPENFGPKHEKGRNLGYSFLSIRGADAIMKEQHTLVHPGIPLCRPHVRYVNELISKFNPPASKKAKIDDTDSCSDDPSYVEPKNKKNLDKVTKSFSSFASSAGQSRVCTKKSWNELKAMTKEKKACAARKLYSTMLEIIVPDETDEFRELVEKKTSKKWTTGSPENLDAIMKQIASHFFAAEDRTSKLLVLSLASNSLSYLGVVEYIPYLSRYMYEQSKVFGRRKRSETAVLSHELDNFHSVAVRAFIDFITSPTVMIGLPYGVRKVKMADGSKIEIPNTIRQQSATEIIEMWTKISKEVNPPIPLLSSSTMYKMLNACSATKRVSSTCVDYFVANGMEGFDELHEISEEWRTEGLIEEETLKSLKKELDLAVQYLRTDFRLHVKSHSRIADHCANFALSDPSKPKLASSCSVGIEKHTHDLKYVKFLKVP